MEILNCTKLNSASDDNLGCDRIKQSASPAFKGFAPMSAVGSLMQNIENGGFVVSFLIQDFLGMTAPRTCAGFLRDSEVTGEYNIQEGFEVLGREGLTGPCMMAVAPIALIVAAKCGKTTSVNSQLIKRFGNSLKEIIAGKNFSREILKDKTKFKEHFYKNNIQKILEQSVGKENVNKDAVDYIFKQIKNYENIPEGTKLSKFRGKAKYKQECLRNISEYIDNIKYSTSSDLDALQKIKFGSEINKDLKIFDTKKTFDAMVKYADDAITANKQLEKLDASMAESIKNKSIGRRIITNISMIFATLGVLSVLPKIYARSNISPGARTQMVLNNQNTDNTNNKQDVSFKGKPGNSKSLLEKLGELIGKNKSDFVSSELEYNGNNFTNTLMAGLSVFGLITPRGIRAYKRAQKDEDGKKDLTELWEIILRDITSSLAVVFAVPMMTRAAVTSYEKKSGFVLMQKDRNMTKWQTFVDVINPYSKSHVLKNSEITSLYEGVNTQEKMINFCKYIDRNGGDLRKILLKSENADKIFNDTTINLSKLNNINKLEANKQIINFAENLDVHAKKLLKENSVDKNKINKIVTDIMKGTKPGKNNITKYAKGLNSIPAAIATLFISPYILGWVIPRLTYQNTRRIHEKQAKQKQLKTTA